MAPATRSKASTSHATSSGIVSGSTRDVPMRKAKTNLAARGFHKRYDYDLPKNQSPIGNCAEDTVIENLEVSSSRPGSGNNKFAEDVLLEPSVPDSGSGAILAVADGAQPSSKQQVNDTEVPASSTIPNK